MLILKALMLGVYGFVILVGFIAAAALVLGIIGLVAKAVKHACDCDVRDL